MSSTDAGTFEDRVRSIVQDTLDTPLLYPQGLKTWIPPWVAMNAQIPIGNIVGVYTVADTVSGLGDGTHGRTGVVRAGATPYDYIKMTFDGTRKKWISDPVIACAQIATDTAVTTTTTDAPNPNCTQDIVPFGVLDTAGLQPEVRLFSVIKTAGGAATAKASFFIQTQDVGSSSTSTTGSSAWVNSTTATNFTMLDTGWKAISVTAKDVMWFGTGLWTTDAAQAATSHAETLNVRWISK